MNVTINLSVLAIAAIAVACVYFLVRAIREFSLACGRVVEVVAKLTPEVAGAREEVKSLRALILPATSGLEKVYTELQGNLAGVPKLLEVMTKIGEMQFESTQRLGKLVAGVGNAAFGKVRTPMPQQDLAGAESEYRIMTMMREQGISREQAMMTMNQANEASVWDGFGIEGTR